MVCHSDVYQGRCSHCCPVASPGGPGRAAFAGNCTWYGNVPRHHEAEPLARLRRDEHRVAELDLLLLRGRRSARAALLGRLQLLHLGALREVGAHRTRDGQGQHADDRGEDRRPTRRRAEPLLGLLRRLRNRRDRSTSRGSSLRCRARAAGRVARLARRGSKTGATAPVRLAGLPGPTPGTAASDRAVSLRARAIWPRRPRTAGTPGRRRSGRRRRGSPRYAAAGCTWRRARCGRVRRS